MTKTKLHFSQKTWLCLFCLFFSKYSILSNCTSLKQQLRYYRRRYIYRTPLIPSLFCFATYKMYKHFPSESCFYTSFSVLFYNSHRQCFAYYCIGKYAYSDAEMHSKSVPFSDAAYVGSKWQDCSLGFETELFLKQIHVIVHACPLTPIYLWSIILM